MYHARLGDLSRELAPDGCEGKGDCQQRGNPQCRPWEPDGWWSTREPRARTDQETKHGHGAGDRGGDTPSQPAGPLFSRITGKKELPDGYAFEFPGDPQMTEKLVNFIQGERSCCTFFRFELEFEPDNGPVWLSLRGPDPVKSFIDEAVLALKDSAVPER